MYDDLVLFQCCCVLFCFVFFGRREVLEAIDEFIDSHRQRGVRLLLLVAGAVLACVLLYFFRAFFSFLVFFAFYGVLCGNCKCN